MRAKSSVLIAIIFIILLLGVLPMCSNPLIEKLIEGDQKESNPEITTLSGVSLNPTTLTLLVSETETLTATVRNSRTNQTVTWTSSDDLIATVNDNGIVTALAAGSATITVATVDGNHWATCTVTVRECTGEVDAPFLIHNEIQLRQVGIADGWNLSAHYKLTADITLNSEWTPIDDDNTGFIGGFDGNNKTITGLSVNNSAASYQGMFGLIGVGGVVKNLRLDNCYVHGDTNVGGLAGQNRGTVQNSYVTGVVKGENVQISGVTGANFGTVENCYFTGTVSGTGNQIGGVAGRNEKGTITNCNAEGDVSGTNNIGGVVGYNNAGIIENCYATGTVNGTGNSIGGVVGYNTGTATVDNCHATGNVSGTGNGTGGVVGTNQVSATVINCYAAGDVNGTGYNIGGVAGSNAGTMENCHATGIVSGDKQVGGVAGINPGTVEKCYATGNVSGNECIGGVAGYNQGLLTNCYSTGNVDGNKRYVGGVVGDNSYTVENCYATGNVSGDGYVGGVAGSNYGPVKNSYATGSVTGTSDRVGGVVGYNFRNDSTEIGTVENCYAMGNVSGNNYVGGVAGSGTSETTVMNCYATGNVSGNSYIGGVVGGGSGTLKNSYACGVISGTSSVGGVAGSGSAENCVALNPNINSTTYYANNGRIGYVSGINNYAQKDMQFNNNSIGTWFNNANDKYGADITAANYHFQSWWNSRAGFDFSETGAWEWHSASKLPVLKGLGQQAPKVTPVITAEITSVVSGTAFEMVWINAGTFLMGSPPAEPGRDSDKETQHPVTLTSGFYMGKYQVTQAQYEIVMEKTIAEQRDRGQGDNYPMYYVSYYDALVFCNKLSMLEGLSPAYRINGSTDPAAWGDVPTISTQTWNANIIVSGSTGYRLPTEAQWEYSCRAGSTEAYNWGTNTINQTQAQYNGNPLTTAVVGSYAPNAWGLYDMHGNVDEWCWDWYSPNYGSTAGAAVTDPMVGAGASTSNPFIIRGGNFQDAGSKARSANRGTGTASSRHVTFGFRIIRPF